MYDKENSNFLIYWVLNFASSGVQLARGSMGWKTGCYWKNYLSTKYVFNIYMKIRMVCYLNAMYKVFPFNYLGNPVNFDRWTISVGQVVPEITSPHLDFSLDLYWTQWPPTVRSLILRNRLLQISLKLLNTLLFNFAACNHIKIVRFGSNRFFLITSGKYWSGRGPLHPMGNV